MALRVADRGDGASAGWPTTLRFSRRMGEAQRGAAYACAVEGRPARHHPLRMLIATWLRKLRKALTRRAAPRATAQARHPV